MKRPIQVLVYVAAHVQGRRKYLLLRRIPSRGGYWQGVTGGLNHGEEICDAALRETVEEAGLILHVIHRIEFSYSIEVNKEWQHLYPAGTNSISEYIFWALTTSVKRPHLDPCEHDSYRWCSLAEARRLLKWPKNREALEHCDTSINAFLTRTPCPPQSE